MQHLRDHARLENIMGISRVKHYEYKCDVCFKTQIEPRRAGHFESKNDLPKGWKYDSWLRVICDTCPKDE